MMDSSGLPCRQREGCFLDNPINTQHQLLVDLLAGLSGRGMDYSSSTLREHYDTENKMHRSINFPSYLLIRRQSSRGHLKSSLGEDWRRLRESGVSRWVPDGGNRDGQALQHGCGLLTEDAGHSLVTTAVFSQNHTLKCVYNKDYSHFSSAANTSMQM